MKYVVSPRFTWVDPVYIDFNINICLWKPVLSNFIMSSVCKMSTLSNPVPHCFQHNQVGNRMSSISRYPEKIENIVACLTHHSMCVCGGEARPVTHGLYTAMHTNGAQGLFYHQ